MPTFIAAAHRAFPGAALRERGLDQILPAEQDSGTLRPAQPLAPGEAEQVDAHPRVGLQVLDWRDARGIVEQQRHAGLLGDGERGLQVVAEPRGVDHRRAIGERGGEIVDAADDDELRAGEPDGAVEGAPSAEHHDFVLQAGGVGQLPHLFRIGPAMQPAVAAAIAPAAPEVTMPDSAPDSSASFRPAACWSSKMSTKCWAASSMALRT